MTKIPQVCPICELGWDVHLGPEFVAHLIETLNKILEKKYE